MLPNNQTEGNQPATGGQEQPTSAPSGAPAGQPLPDYVTALQNQVSELSGVIKGLQKGTDKRFGQMDTNIKRILELKDQGLNETQIQRELWIDSQMTPQSQSAPVQPSVGNGSATNTGIDVEPIIASLQFQPNDPGLAALKVKFQGDPNGLAKAAADLRLAQLQTPSPSGATSLSQTGSTTAGLDQNQADAKVIHLESLYKNYSQNKGEIQALEKELKDAGVLH